MNRDLATLQFGLDVIALCLARRDFALARAYCRDLRIIERRLTRRLALSCRH